MLEPKQQLINLMTSTRWFLFLLIFQVPHSSLYAADPVAPTVNLKNAPSPAALLKQKRFAELDRHLTSLQNVYEKDTPRASSLLAAYWAMTDENLATRENYDEWVGKYPQSYAAHLARGLNYISLGGSVRGSQYIDETPAENVAQMKQYFAKAMPDLEKSLSLTAKPLLSYYGLIAIGKHVDTKNNNRHWLDAANAIDPSNILIKEQYLLALRPQWGGSLEEMIAFVKESDSMPLSDINKKRLESHIWRARARASRLNKDYRAAIEYYSNAITLYDQAAQVYVNRGWVYGQLKENDKAISDYSRAIVLAPSYVRPLISRAIIYRTLGEYDQSLADLTRAVELAPKDKTAWTSRGSVYDRQKRYAEAVADYKIAARLGDAWAQYKLGTHYRSGQGVVQDRNQSMVWFTEAARNGSVEALHVLREEGIIP